MISHKDGMMTDLTLDVARKISDAALAKCRELKLKPMKSIAYCSCFRP